MAASVQDVQRMALAVLQTRLFGPQLVEEYRSVIGQDFSIRHSFTVAQAPGNAPRNRYVNVLPYDHNRVRLKPCCDGTGASRGSTAANGAGDGPAGGHPAPSPDYINASHVQHDDPHCGFSVHYIACQGPLAGTVADFWRMCWSEGVGAVVMLTNTVERGVSKCWPYYPAQPGSRMALNSQAGGAAGAALGGRTTAQPTTPLPPQQPQPQQQQRAAAAGGGGGCSGATDACVAEVVALESRSLHGGDLTHTRMQLLAPAAAAQGPAGPQQAGWREVSHLRYNAWPDHGTPADAAAIRTLCDLLGPVREAGGAVVVHCSAGIGRTGTFCAIDILRRRLGWLAARAAAAPGSVTQSSVASALDLPELVHSLRRQRGGMVQTLEQYAFCYQAVYEELAAAVGAGAGSGGHDGLRTPPGPYRR